MTLTTKLPWFPTHYSKHSFLKVKPGQASVYQLLADMCAST